MLVVLLVGQIGFAGAVGAEAATADVEEVEVGEQTLQVADDVTLNGDIAIIDVAEDYPQGVLYIDFRTAGEEGVALDRDSALRLGMRYESIPVDGPQITDAAVAQLEGLLAERGRYEHTVLRCGSGNRAAMMWGATRIDAGESLDQVMEQLQPIITKDKVKQALRDFAGSRDH